MSGQSSENDSLDKLRMSERKRIALEPDSSEEQDFRRSFEDDYNRFLNISTIFFSNTLLFINYISYTLITWILIKLNASIYIV